jgi:hypothetical protein
MRIAASYECPVLPPYGVQLQKLHTVFEPFDVDFTGVNVRVEPVVDEDSYDAIMFIDEEGEEIWGKRPYLTLTLLRARMERDTEANDWESFDRRRFDQPARLALEATLQQLRVVGDWVEINTHLRWLKVDYRLPSGDALPWKTPFYVNFEGIGHVLDSDHWQRIASAVKSRHRTKLADELLLEARRFLLQRNSRFALVSAAVACEVIVREKVVDALTRTGGMTAGQADGYFQQVRNPQLTALLPCFYQVPDGLVRAVDEVFNQRNMILHGRQHKQPTREKVREAIRTAETLSHLSPLSAR